MVFQSEERACHDGSMRPRTGMRDVEMVTSAGRLKRAVVRNDIPELTALANKRTAGVGFGPCSCLLVLDHGGRPRIGL